MRKSQIKSKLDQDLYFGAKNQAIETKFLERNRSDNNKSNGKQNINLENTDNFGLPNAQSYIYAAELTCSSCRDADAIDTLEFLVLFYMPHILYVANNQQILNKIFRYNMDMFKTSYLN